MKMMFDETGGEDGEELDRRFAQEGAAHDGGAEALVGAAPDEMVMEREERALGALQGREAQSEEERRIEAETAWRLIDYMVKDGIGPQQVAARLLSLVKAFCPERMKELGLTSLEKEGIALGYPQASARATRSAQLKRHLKEPLERSERRAGRAGAEARLPWSKGTVASEKVAEAMRGRQNRLHNGEGHGANLVRLKSVPEVGPQLARLYQLKVMEEQDEADVVISLHLPQSQVRALTARMQSVLDSESL